MTTPHPPGTATVQIVRHNGQHASTGTDLLAMEEPMEARLLYWSEGQWYEKQVAVTMRTPGEDADLAVGFLFTEGIIAQASDIAGIRVNEHNVVTVTLHASAKPRLHTTDRQFYTTSSCGICGKASIDAVTAACALPANTYPYDNLRINAATLATLPQQLRAAQTLFEQTGGIHGCGLFTPTGTLLYCREDVGRHNAMDKLIGHCLMAGALPLGQQVLLLSGRASFELVQKAAMAGIKAIAAVGAPSSLAVQMAEEWNITLVGFLRGDRFNVYSGGQRIVI